MAKYKVAIDAGHGGSDPGAVYNNRKEKDDTLKLAMAVGEILESNDIDVFYVRTTDEYETPFKKATDANNSGADLFVSIHRNSSETPNKGEGIQTLIYNNSGIKPAVAKNINSELASIGFKNLGIDLRPNLVVLKRTKMPAVLVEAGFINNDSDNKLFDENFDKIAAGISNGIIKTLSPNERSNTKMMSSTQTQETVIVAEEVEEEALPLYRVQVGAYKNRDNADRMLNSLTLEGFPAFIIYEDGFYKVQVGAFKLLTNAIKMERRLRRFRYSTYIVYS